MTGNKKSFLSRSYIWLTMFFLYAPIIVLIIYSFNESKSRSHFSSFSLKWYRELIHNDAIMHALMTTLIVALVSAVFATILGTLAAIGIQSMRKKSRDVLMNFTYIPVVSPEIVMGVSLMLLFSLMHLKAGLFTLILAHITFNVPYVILSVMPKLRQMDKYLFDAAMDLGCTPRSAFMKVMLPEIMPGILSGFLMAVTFSLDDFNVSYFVSGDKYQTLPILIYSMTRRRVSPEINALSTIIFVTIFAILIIVNISEVHRERQIAKKNSRALKVPALVLASFIVLGALAPALTSPVYADTADTSAGKNTSENNGNVSISVYNWGEYLCDGSDGLIDICKEFTKRTGIEVYYTNFATNEELYAKLKGGNAKYDVIFPSDYMVARMIKEDMLAPLDYDNIPNARYMNPKFMDPDYDPGSVYSLPYSWNTVGIIYNKKLVDEVPRNWDILWDEKYKGQILMFSNSRDAFAIACKSLGYSMNTESEKELREAADLLVEQKPLIQAYVMDQIFDKMENNEAAIAPYYAGDATLMMPYNEDIAVAFPDEGTNLFMDAVCIPKDAPQKEAAEMFIDFLNEPEVAADNARFIGYATPNLAAYDLLEEEIRENEAIYPPDYVIEDSEQFIHLSEETNLLIDTLWTEVMAKGDSFLKWGLPPVVVILAIIIGKSVYRIKKKAAYKKMSEDL